MSLGLVKRLTASLYNFANFSTVRKFFMTKPFITNNSMNALRSINNAWSIMSSKESSFLKSSYIEKKRKEIIKVNYSSKFHGVKQTMLNHTVYSKDAQNWSAWFSGISTFGQLTLAMGVFIRSMGNYLTFRKSIFAVPNLFPLLGVLGAWMTFNKAEMEKNP